VEELEVHPVADLFPMLADDELQELADDIRERGLLQPIVLDAEGRVLDGRNRLAACALAGIEPTFETYAGEDADGYALAVNINRRHLRPSQRYLLIEKARRRTKVRKLTIAHTAGEKLGLSEAAVVLDYAPDLAEMVLGNNMALQRAAELARDRKRDAAELKARNERLRAAAPDLADQVDDGRLDLDEALGALDVREEKARQEAEAARLEEEARLSAEQRAADERAQEDRRRRRVATALLCDLVGSLAKTNGSDSADLYDAELAESGRLTSTVIDAAREALEHIAATLKERGAL
jgi:ParB-like chromosome segregation protein Spo0J